MISIDTLLHQVTFITLQLSCPVVGLFMPSQNVTKVNFLRAIFCNKKKALKQTNVIRVVVPHFEELSVKNRFDDAMNDLLIKDYLPDLD